VGNGNPDGFAASSNAGIAHSIALGYITLGVFLWSKELSSYLADAAEKHFLFGSRQVFLGSSHFEILSRNSVNCLLLLCCWIPC
jgi:hypothetical protein